CFLPLRHHLHGEDMFAQTAFALMFGVPGTGAGGVLLAQAHAMLYVRASNFRLDQYVRSLQQTHVPLLDKLAGTGQTRMQILDLTRNTAPSLRGEAQMKTQWTEEQLPFARFALGVAINTQTARERSKFL